MPLLNKKLFVADAMLLLLSLGYGLVASLLSVYLDSIGVSLANIGIIFSLGIIIGGLIRIPFGTLIDNVGRKRFILFSMLGYPIFSFGLFFASNMYHFVGLNVLLEISAAIFWVAFSAYYLDSMDKGSEGTEMAVRNTVSFGVGAITPLLAGLIVDILNFRYLFLIGGVIGLFAIPIALLLKDNKHNITQKSMTSEYETLLNKKGIHTILILVIALNAVIALWYIYMPIYLHDLGFSLGMIGAIIAAFNGVSALIQIPLGKLIDNLPARYLIVPGFFIAWIFGLFFLATKRVFVMALSRVALEVGTDMCYWPGIAALSRMTSRLNHGGAWALLQAVNALSFGIIAVVGGYMAELHGIQSVLAFTSWLSLFIGLAFVPSAVLSRRGFVNRHRHFFMQRMGHKNRSR